MFQLKLQKLKMLILLKISCFKTLKSGKEKHTEGRTRRDEKKKKLKGSNRKELQICQNERVRKKIRRGGSQDQKKKKILSSS